MGSRSYSMPPIKSGPNTARAATTRFAKRASWTKPPLNILNSVLTLGFLLSIISYMIGQVAEPKVVTKVDWKNFFLALFLGTTLISLGVVFYYQFELNKLTPPLPINFSKERSSKQTSSTPSAEQASPSATPNR